MFHYYYYYYYFYLIHFSLSLKLVILRTFFLFLREFEYFYYFSLSNFTDEDVLHCLLLLYEPIEEQVKLLMQLCDASEDVQTKVKCIGALECLAQFPSAVDANRVSFYYALPSLPPFLSGFHTQSHKKPKPKLKLIMV